MTSPATTERLALCDLFDDLGPDEPTLSGDWTTRDLAAHLVVRERRPDAAIGIVSSFLHDYSERVRQDEARRPFPEIVQRVRTGPPVWNPMHFGPIDTAVNSLEFFVHHEDVRRAQPEWVARDLEPEVSGAIATSVARVGKLLTRKLDVGLALAPDDRPEIRLSKGEPTVTISGPIGECVLYVYGRKEHAQVQLAGPDDAVATVQAATFGI